MKVSITKTVTRISDGHTPPNCPCGHISHMDYEKLSLLKYFVTQVSFHQILIKKPIEIMGLQKLFLLRLVYEQWKEIESS